MKRILFFTKQIQTLILLFRDVHCCQLFIYTLSIISIFEKKNMYMHVIFFLVLSCVHTALCNIFLTLDFAAYP